MIAARLGHKSRVLRIAERKLGARAESTRLVLLVGLLVVAIADSAVAQASATSTIVGTVTDTAKKLPLSGADVLLVERQVRTRTDSAGTFRFADVPEGTITLEVRRVGYQMHSSQCIARTSIESRCDVALQSTVVLDTVRSTAPVKHYMSPGLNGFEERRKTGHGYYLNEEELRKLDNRTLPSVLRRIPGIKIVSASSRDFAASSRTAGDGKVGALQGGSGRRNCYISVYEDGVPVYTAQDGQQLLNIGLYQTRNYAAIEFYPGSSSLPAQFSSIRASDCGVLLLWTRER